MRMRVIVTMIMNPSGREARLNVKCMWGFLGIVVNVGLGFSSCIAVPRGSCFKLFLNYVPNRG